MRSKLAVLVMAAMGLSLGRSAAAKVFQGVFSPLGGQVSALEEPLRQELCLNGSWQFQAVPMPANFVWDNGTPPDLTPPKADAWDAVAIKIPSPWNVNTWGNGRNVGAGKAHPYWPDSVYYPSYPLAWDDVQMAWMRRSFKVPAGWEGRQVLLHFEAVAGDCQVFINGKKLAEHFDTYIPFDVDVTSALLAGQDNELLVGVRHSILLNKQSPTHITYKRPYPNGSNTDNLAGIWQDVSLLGLPPVRIQDTFAKPDLESGSLELELTLSNDSTQAATVEAAADIHPWINQAGASVLESPEPKWSLGPTVLKLPTASLTLAAGETKKLSLKVAVAGSLKTWSPDAPNLNMAVVSLSQNGQVVDRDTQRFGWRQFRIKGKEIELNGKKIQMVGDLSHPFGPFMMSRRFAWAWFKMIKDMGGNAVRPHAQPYPRYYLQVADEMGIVVLDETALFGSSICLNLEEPEAWERFDRHFDGLILRDRNHPSVVGWSEANEMFANFFANNKISPADKERWYIKGLGQLAARAKVLDPTRDWVSCDGDEDLDGQLPIWSKHFGHGLHHIPEMDKPIMVGESGGTYYATPEQLSVFNGQGAYASYAQRNDALAMDLYQNVVQNARPKLAYYSPSEMIWFGLEHLPLGYDDFDRLPGLQDGIFFGPYKEGQFGMQLERIPPYTGTLNPGFDSGLPLYKPLAMFHAMQAAMAKAGPKPCAWDKIQGPAPEPDTTLPAPRYAKAAFLGDRSGDLYRRLYAMGVDFFEPGQSDQAQLLIIDGEALSEDMAKRAKPGLDAFLAKGGLAWVLLRSPKAALGAVQILFPQGISVSDREATALEPGKATWLAGLTLPQLYFAENGQDKQILKAGLGGAWVEKASQVLTASNTDWSQFNQAPEAAKCGATVLYEQLHKPAGAALVEGPLGKGRLRLSSIDYLPEDADYLKFWRLLLAKSGLALAQARGGWLLPPSRATGVKWRSTEAKPAAAWIKPDFDDRAWKESEGGFGTEVPEGRPRTPWVSDDIWLRKDFEVKGPVGALKLLLHHDEDAEVYLNGKQVFSAPGFTTHYENHDLDAAASAALVQGRNVMAIHCHQTTGGQFIDAGLSSDSSAPDAATGGKRAHDLLLDGPLQ